MSTTKINRAREAITEESLKIGGDLARFCEEEVNKWLINESAAEKVMAEGKSIKGLIAFITAEARKEAKNNCACLSDERVTEIIREYYGFGDVLKPVADIIDITDFL